MWNRFSGTHFVRLQLAVFCAECELISENPTSRCLACGSLALLSISRLMGGSLQNQPTAHLIADVELDRLVRELLQTVPSSSSAITEVPVERSQPCRTAVRHHIRLSETNTPPVSQVSLPVEIDLAPAVGLITERAQALTGATGAAIALRHGNEIVCRARAGRTAPDLGVRLQMDSGISAACFSAGEPLLCHDTENDPWVDLRACRRLGVRSILAMPLRHLRRTLGLFEVLSSSPHAFDDRHINTMQLLSGVAVAAMSRISTLRTVSQNEPA